MISYFNGPITNTKPIDTITPEKWIEKIKSPALKEKIDKVRSIDDKKERNKIKQTLGFALLSGTFSERNASGLLKHSGLICLDLDDLPDAQMTKCGLETDRYCFVCAISPSGNGLKMIVKTGATNADNHGEYFDALAEYLKITYGLDVDAKGRDVCRATFDTYDPTCFSNPLAEMFTVKKPSINTTPLPDIAPAVFQKIKTLVESKGFAFAMKAGDGYYKITCPECGQPESAWLYKGKHQAQCNHKAHCDKTTDFTMLFVDVAIDDFSADIDDDGKMNATFDLIRFLSPRRKEDALKKIKKLTGNSIDTIRQAYEQRTRETLPKKITVAERFELEIPDGWSMSKEDGICNYDNQRVIPRLVYIDQIGRDVSSGEVFVRLVYWFRNSEHKRIVPMKTITTRKGITDSAAFGVPITDDSAMPAIRFFSDFYALNENLFEHIAVVSQLGWVAKKFVFPDRIFSSNEDETEKTHFVGAENLKYIFEKKGTLARWVEGVKMLGDFTDAYIARFMLYASFASVLLEPLGKQPFIIHLCGESSSGKTTTLEMLASVYGDPTAGKAVMSWNSTEAAIIRTAENFKNVPLFLDELGANNKNIFPVVVMQIERCMSRMKADRFNPHGISKVRSFKVGLFSTGEYGAVGGDDLNGAKIRVMDFDANPFGKPLPQAQYDKFCDLVENNYGHAIDVFLGEYLKGNHEIEKANIFADQEKALALSPKEQRVKRQIDFILGCACIVTEIFDFKFNVFDDCRRVWEYLKVRLSENTNEEENTLETILGYVSSHPANFPDKKAGNLAAKFETYNAPIYGFHEGEKLVFNAGILTTIILNPGNENLNAARQKVKNLVKKGILRDGQMRINGVVTKVKIFLNNEKFEEHV